MHYNTNFNSYLKYDVSGKTKLLKAVLVFRGIVPCRGLTAFQRKNSEEETI